jgi:hypothetical protein
MDEAAVKTRQACYEGTVGARAMHALQNYGQAIPTQPLQYLISATYHDGTLKMYSHHLTQPSQVGESHQVHMAPLRGIVLTNSPETFRYKVSAFRDACDSTRQQAEMLVDRTNRAAQTQQMSCVSFSLEEVCVDSASSRDDSGPDRPRVLQTKRQRKDLNLVAATTHMGRSIRRSIMDKSTSTLRAERKTMLIACRLFHVQDGTVLLGARRSAFSSQQCNFTLALAFTFTANLSTFSARSANQRQPATTVHYDYFDMRTTKSQGGKTVSEERDLRPRTRPVREDPSTIGGPALITRRTRKASSHARTAVAT